MDVNKIWAFSCKIKKKSLTIYTKNIHSISYANNFAY